MALHDGFHKLQCALRVKASCDVPMALPQYKDAFNLTQPLCNPKLIMSIVKRNFPKSVEVIQAGATVTVGSALFCLIYPIKFGFFGYLMIIYGLFTDGVTAAIPGLAFLPIFAIATDIGSMFKRHTVAPGSTAAPAQDGTPAPKDASASTGKVGSRKKKR
jgi:hypothetical protein